MIIWVFAAWICAVFSLLSPAKEGAEASIRVQEASTKQIFN
jgi:hypothetical protein